MKIDIRHIAALAKLNIADSEITAFETQMQDIVHMVERLPELSDDYSDMDPTRPMELRVDEIRPSVPRDELLANAPEVQAGCVVVPRTVE